MLWMWWERTHRQRLKCKELRKSKPGAKMFVAREILDKDDDGRANDEVIDQDKESGGHDENDQTPWDQYDSDVVGSNIAQKEKRSIWRIRWWSLGHVDRVEQMYALRIKSMNLLDYHNKFAVISEPDFDEPIIKEYNNYNPQDEDQDSTVAGSQRFWIKAEPVQKKSSKGEFPILVESDDSRNRTWWWEYHRHRVQQTLFSNESRRGAKTRVWKPGQSGFLTKNEQLQLQLLQKFKILSNCNCNWLQPNSVQQLQPVETVATCVFRCRNELPCPVFCTTKRIK